ncbi:hypothetical protein KXW97_009288, partial [Aspergillus fumigatus]
MQCHYVTRSIKTIKQHWREHHGWKVLYKGGRPRFFPSRKGSHYIWVQRPNQQPEEQARTTPTPTIQAAVDAVVQAWEQAQARARANQAIQASQLTDANPWLRMTR